MIEKEKLVLLKVLDMYKKITCLWQHEDNNYKNKQVRYEAYKDLLQIYKNFDENATVKHLKKKVDNMRTAYFREHKKVLASKRTGAGANEIYKPTLWYYEAFSFLGCRTESSGPQGDSFENEKNCNGSVDVKQETRQNVEEYFSVVDVDSVDHLTNQTDRSFEDSESEINIPQHDVGRSSVFMDTYPKWLIEVEQKRASAELSRARAEEQRASAFHIQVKASMAQADALKRISDAATIQAEAIKRLSEAATTQAVAVANLVKYLESRGDNTSNETVACLSSVNLQ